MKRDMDIVRKLLLETEALESSKVLQVVYFDRGTAAALGIAGREASDIGDAAELYNASLLADARLANCDLRRYSHGTGEIRIESLTWEGHEFLDSIRSEEVWRRSKSRLAESIEGVSFTVIKKIAEDIAEKMLGL